MAGLFLQPQPRPPSGTMALRTYGSKSVSVHGSVVELECVNPHALIVFTSRTTAARFPNGTRNSRVPTFFHGAAGAADAEPGDAVIITGHPVKNGAHAMAAQKVVFADGRETPKLGFPDPSK